MAKSHKDLWCIVLAAGEGSRLHALTRDRHGNAVPKQFCSFIGEKSMLRSTLERVEKIVPRERVIVIVAQQHEMWWADELADWPERNVVVQPRNKGTAVGILLPLLNVMGHDLDAKVLIVPSDHYVEDEGLINAACIEAVDMLDHATDQVILLGVTPDTDDSEYGWIVPKSRREHRPASVSYFVEKPKGERVRELVDKGGLWNSFIFAAYGNALMNLYGHHLPDLLDAFLKELDNHPQGFDRNVLGLIYENLPVLDFSKHLLEKSVQNLCVLQVPACGWSDLGTPDRIVHVRDHHVEETGRRTDAIIRAPSRPNSQILHP